MKKSRTILASTLAAATLASLTGAVHPAAAVGKFAYTAGVQVQNLTATAASGVISFYNADGTSACGPSFTVPASGSFTMFPLDTCVPAGFNGSAVVSSDQQVAAIVNVLGNNGVAAAAYDGIQTGATTVQVPLLMKGNFGFDTWLRVQNVGSAATDITMNYTDGTAATVKNVAAGAAATFDQSAEPHSVTVFGGSATASQPVAVTAIEENAKTLFAYDGFTAGSTNPVIPLVNANNFGFISGLGVKNSGSAATNVTISYTPSGPGLGTACTETQNIPAGGTATFALGAFTLGVAAGTTTNCARGATFVGAAQVTANSASQPLTVIVNQLNNTTGAGEAYSAFDPTAATSSVVAPLIMDRNFNYFTGMSIMNVGTGPTSITCSFSGSGVTQSTASVAAGAAFTVLQVNAIGNGYVGSATCNAGAGGKIVGIVNELNSTDAGDRFLVYEMVSK